ncbi:MAG: DUF4834 family protein [Bacteroidales bacterium]|nr:DUF4834 family protein [Bacteroidales bacterium]
MKFIYLLLLLFLIYYLLKAVMRLLRIFMLSNSNSSNSDRSGGDVRIEGKPRRFTSRQKEKGEYVDYEEIK